MATIIPTIYRDNTRATVSWANVTSTNLAEAVSIPGYRLTSLIISNYAGAGAITFSAGNDEAGANIVAGLKDRTGTVITTAANAMFGLGDDVLWLQPVVASGVTGNKIDAHYIAY